ncbi:TPA: DUF3265 domain-containing protein [Vibrio cholerae]|nr:DUF3265 domain-containing protein [Vibrio cholerae]
MAFLVCGGFGVEVLCGGLVIACLRPLTRRYAFFRKEELWLLKSGEQSHQMLKR